MQKEIIVPKILGAEDFDAQAVNLSIDQCNWPGEFPNTPLVSAKIAHTGSTILLKFSVSEDCTLARVTEDNGEVWTDSCVEFFLSLDDSGYYNFEFNCIGRMLLGFRKEKPNATHAPQAILDTIQRRSTLGTEPFEEVCVPGGQTWDLTVEIPASALFKHSVEDLSGVATTANFYKCGDNLSVPHFLSWSPISTPGPNFHCPEFFGQLRFE